MAAMAAKYSSTDPHGSGSAGPIANITLLLVSIGVSLALAEVGLRLAGYSYTPMKIQVWQTAREGLETNPVDRRMQTAFETENFTHDPVLLWRPRAGVSVFNSRGYRARELAEPKRPEEFRIVAVGDSNTLGWKGPEGASWPLTVEDLLRRASDRFAVINAGVWGYTVFQGQRRFEESLALEPNLVLVSFGANDAHRVSVSDRDFYRTALSTPLPFLSRSKVGLLLVSFWDTWVAAEEAPQNRRVPRVSLEDYRRTLREIVATATARGVDCVLMTRPYQGRTGDPSRWKYYAPDYLAATAEIAAQTDVPLIDLYALFADKPELFIDESHFDARGHQLAAERVVAAMSPLLERHGVLDASELEEILRPPPQARVVLDLGTASIDALSATRLRPQPALGRPHQRLEHRAVLGARAAVARAARRSLPARHRRPRFQGPSPRFRSPSRSTVTTRERCASTAVGSAGCSSCRQTF